MACALSIPYAGSRIALARTAARGQFTGGGSMRARLALFFTGALLAVQAQGQNTEPPTDHTSRADRFQLMTDYTQGVAPQTDKRLYAFATTFRFTPDPRWKHPILPKEPRVEKLFGIDLSHYNDDDCKCVAAWASLRNQKVRYADLKAGLAVNFADRAYKAYRKRAKALPADRTIHAGAYHFLAPTSDSATRANNFITSIGKTVAADDLAQHSTSSGSQTTPYISS